MRAFAVDGFGKPGTVRELPVPEPDEGQVRVRVRAASLNPADLGYMGGAFRDVQEHRFPLIPGVDLAGTVEGLGAGVTGFSQGDEVFGGLGKRVAGEGSLAEYVTASAGSLARRPAGIDPEFAAAISLAGASAVQTVDAAQIKRGETVLIIGAAGGIGGIVVQLVRALGATAVAVAQSAHHGYLRELGAAETIDYTTQDVLQTVRSAHGDGIAAILDMAGNRESNNQLAQVLQQDGVVVSMTGGADTEALAARGLRGINVMTNTNTETLERLVALVEDGTVHRPEITTYSLDEAGAAYAKLATRHLRGKLVVVF
jgi:NADPH:quinone reductase-like Zn-dependent oxidoreductase